MATPMTWWGTWRRQRRRLRTRDFVYTTFNRELAVISVAER